MSPHGAVESPSGHLVSVGGHQLHMEATGGAVGEVVVLLHSGLGTTTEWRRLVPVLSAHGFRPIAYDRPGHGRSDARDGPAPPPFDADVADLERLLDALDVGTAALVGHSDGGTIALSLAARRPGRVTCVVAVAAHVCVELKTRHGIAELLRQTKQDERLAAALARRHGDKASAVLDAWARAWLHPDALRWDIRPELAAIECPTLVVQGLEDEYATEDHARDIAAWIDGAELWLEPGVGHLLPQAIPDAFHARVLAFLVGRDVGRG